MEMDENLKNKRHSLAHLMAAAVMELWPDTKRTIGPAVDNGFYFDFEFSTPLSDEELPKIEAKMREILPTWDTFERSELGADEAKAEYPDNQYKHELIDEFTADGSQVSFYKSGNYWDLCKGGHVEHMGEIDPDSFRLDKVAGAYWRGDEKNTMLTRIYGLAFNTKQELEEHVAMIEEAKKRDHRKLGQELDLFTFSPLVGGGLPLFTPRGTVLREQLTNFAEDLRKQSGFERVSIPHITKTDLYKVSGHWDKFGDELFLVKSQETSDEFALKPMNCPHHNQIYSSQPRSYRDLPVRYFETTTVYRDEKTGELGGLSRVRSITQDDSHVYARQDQLETEVAKLIEDIQTLYGTIGMGLKARLSFRDDSDKYLGDQSLWDLAQGIIRDLAAKNELQYFEAEGEAAFYGPKIDFMGTDAIGREHQVATVQLDFVQPERFELEYTAEDGNKQRPVMIHCALLGSIERFLSVYIEHTAGKFPVWVAPEQIRVISVNQEEPTINFVNDFVEKAKSLGLRVGVDNSNESVGKKIRAAEVAKVPYSVVIGQKEIDSGRLTPRVRADMVIQTPATELSVYNLLKSIANEAISRVNHTSL